MRKSGKSYLEIEATLKIPRSTLSEWFNGEGWSAEIRAKLDQAAREGHRVRIIELDRIRGIGLAKAYEDARLEAVKELAVLKYHPLFVAGVMIYWGEGDKRGKNQVRIANTDPTMVLVFVKFLKEVCGIPEDDIRASLLVYPDLDEVLCREHWSKESGIPMQNFRKSTRILGRHKTQRLGYGICNVYVSSSYLKKKILEWIRLLPKELMAGEYYASI